MRSEPAGLWRALLDRYPTLAALFGGCRSRRCRSPIARASSIASRARPATRWALLPHAYAFVDPLFSTGIAWSLRAVERLGLAFERAARGRRMPEPGDLARYDALLAAEADQLDRVPGGRLRRDGALRPLRLSRAASTSRSFRSPRPASGSRQGTQSAWEGLLGVGDPAAEPLPAECRRRLGVLACDEAGRRAGTAEERRAHARWVRDSIEPRNIAGFGDPARHNLYPLDIDALVERHATLGLTRAQLADALPALRGRSVARAP